MRHHIREITPRSDYTIRIVFEPDEVRIFDMNPHFVGVLAPLKNTETFTEVKIAHKGRKIVWPDDLDLCADMLYEESSPALIESYSASL
jgi:hypothetical protein